MFLHKVGLLSDARKPSLARLPCCMCVNPCVVRVEYARSRVCMPAQVCECGCDVGRSHTCDSGWFGDGWLTVRRKVPHSNGRSHSSQRTFSCTAAGTMTSRRQLAGERRASNSGDLNQTPKSPDRRGKTPTSPAPPPSAAAAAAPTTAQRQKELQLRRESERSCATQQWLRDGNGLVPQGLQADEVAQAAPFKLPTLTTAVRSP